MKKKQGIQPGRTGLIFWTMLVVVLVYGVFVYFPIGYGLFTSFFNWNPFRNIFDFVGLGNYTTVLSQPGFWHACLVTLLFTLGSLVLTVGFALLLAGLMQPLKRGIGVYRGIYFMPVIASSVATGMLWNFIFSYNSGLANSILMELGLTKVPWLQNSTLALIVLIFVEAWKDVGYALVLVLAGINNIDASVYESAAIDGCGKVRQFFSITLPLIRNTMTILVITKIIDFMQIYTPIKFITEGGPGTSTQTISFYIFEQAFTFYNFGSASAISFILFLIIFALSLFQFRMGRKGEEM